MNHSIIVGAGKGKRMESKTNKILLSLDEKPIIYHTIKKFEDCELIDNIILVINEDDILEINRIVKNSDFKKVKKTVLGGEKRQDSVYNGIKAISAKEEDVILIHNAANPFVSNKTIVNLINATKENGAAVAAIKSIDTLKEVDDDENVNKTLDRSKIWRMQTPQGMKLKIAKQAFENAIKENYYVTDDVALVEKLGVKVKIVESNIENIKITSPEDLIKANKFVKGARVGIGQDSHRFEEEKEKRLILGGIEIPNEKGFKANSDGDVILHALFNAISQAIGKRSIGCYADKMCLEEGITDSKEYVKVILKKMVKEGYKINNIGIMVEAKKPKLEPFHDQIKFSIAYLLNIKNSQIGLTFTTGEGMTEFGKGLGIQCFVVVTIK